MLAPSNGNMAEVYADFWRMHEIANGAEAAINMVVSATSDMEAEIEPGSTADWYLVSTFPGNDVKAMRWLARRRFGVFRPMQQRQKAHVEGQPIGGMEPVFPGYLFVYAWNIQVMQYRVLNCPGVMAILRTAGGRPIPVNQPDEDGHYFIDKLRALAWVYEPRIGRVAQESDRHQQRRPTKLGRKERKTIDKLRTSLKLLGKFDPSTWAKAAELAPTKRIALLQQALQGPAAEGGALQSA